jgi:hypothetical protein
VVTREGDAVHDYILSMLTPDSPVLPALGTSIGDGLAVSLKLYD